MNILNRLTENFTKVQPLPVGVHHLQAMQDEKPYRLHLRLNKDGSALLILNAATVLQLNPTAAEYAFHFVKGTEPDEAANQISKRYRVDKVTALTDFQNFADQIHELISTPDLDPTSFLNFERVAPHSAGTTLRLDCALTYRLPEDTQAQYAPVKRVDRELSTDEWKLIMDKAWAAGVPHIVFTGGEATLRDDLMMLIDHAEKNGQVCGLLTDGVKLADKDYLEMLLQTGLDHVMVILQPNDPRSWKAIETIVPADLFLTVHLTLTKETVNDAKDSLQKLANLAVENISLSAAESDLLDELLALQDIASSLRLTLRWDLPVPYSAANPISIETVDDEIPAGAGKAWLYVEPDGDVLPAQGEPDKVMGNLLRDESFLKRLFGDNEKSESKQEKKSFTEKDNLGTYYDNHSRGTTYWNTRMAQGLESPFVIYYFDDEKNAREALLELPCIHVAQDSQRLICTEVLDFGCYPAKNEKYAAFLCGNELTYELWEQAKTSFAKHGGTFRNEEEPKKRSAPIQAATAARPDKVVFDREERKFLTEQGVDAIYKFYKAPDAASAKAFLQQNPVTKQFYYIGVETPEGNYGSDIQGIYSY